MQYKWVPLSVWGAVALCYAIGITNRSSLAALGPTAQQHFGIDATTLSAFAVFQLAVYALMQIPVGMLVDRFGSTNVILAGGCLMMLGQLTMALVSEPALAVLARALVGAGDACMFVSGIRMLPAWFSSRHLPVLTQLTALLGQTGQIISILPLAWVVAAYGWTAGYLGLVVLTAMVMLLATVSLRERPGFGTAAERVLHLDTRITRKARPEDTIESADDAPGNRSEDLPVRRRLGATLVRQLRTVLEVPGVRLGFWVHFGGLFSFNTFLLLWGTPFLVGGVGLTREASAGFLNLAVGAGAIFGLFLGPISARFVSRQSLLAFWTIAVILVMWVALILWSAVPQWWLIAILMIVISAGSPLAALGIEIARPYAPAGLGGLVVGVVNTGGMISALLVILLIGAVLDLQGAGTPDQYSLVPFKVAFSVQLPFLVLSLWMIFVEQRRIRRAAA